MLLIGSRALQHRIHGAKREGASLGRSPLDVDVVGTYEEMIRMIGRGNLDRPAKLNQDATKAIFVDGGKIIECEIAWPDSTAQTLIDYVHNDPGSFIAPSGMLVPTMDVLLTIKMAHRFAPQVHFHKTMADIRLMRSLGAVVEHQLLDWLAARQKEVLAKHPKLNVKKAEFFDPSHVPYRYDHDSIHRAVAHEANPAYTCFLKPGSEVFCSKALFEELPQYVRIDSVVEECYVLAIERAHVPHGKLSEKEAFDLALKKVCTTISSGWWREFAWENYHDIQAAYRPGYLTRFNTALAAGSILPF